ncbi:MAG: phosphohistidine phosphatase SixA [Isosphaeraceae bacterium]
MRRLYLLRHGVAAPPEPPDLLDDDRRLTAEGEKKVRQIAKGLRRLDLKLDRIVTSPLPRARRTAEIVADRLRLSDHCEQLDVLRAGNSASAIREWLDTQQDERLMVVGHNPALSDLIGLLIAGSSGAVSLGLRKGGVAALSPNPTGGGYSLDWLARPRLIRRLIL